MNKTIKRLIAAKDATKYGIKCLQMRKEKEMLEHLRAKKFNAFDKMQGNPELALLDDRIRQTTLVYNMTKEAAIENAKSALD